MYFKVQEKHFGSSCSRENLCTLITKDHLIIGLCDNGKTYISLVDNYFILIIDIILIMS